MKKILIGLVTAGLMLFIGSLLYSIFRPRPFSFQYDLSLISRQPYGCSVLKSEMENFFPSKKVRVLGSLDLKPYYDYVVNYNDYGYESSDKLDSSLVYREVSNIGVGKFNFFGISKNLEMSQIDVNSLLLHLFQGNEALLVSDKLNNELTTALGIVTEDYSGRNSAELKKAFSINYKDGEFFQHKTLENYSAIVDFPEGAEIISKNKIGDILGIRMQVGKGEITYFTVPVLFTNYHLLKERREIAESLILDLPLENTYYAQKTGGRADNYSQQPGLLSFIHSQTSLTWAFYTLLFSVLLFMFFRIRRLQRIIPVVKPPSNSSLEYVTTLSNLYLLHNNHKETALKKMNYFLNQIRTEYQLNTQKIDEDFYLRLSQKTSVDKAIVKQLFIKYHYINARQVVSPEDFRAFCELLQHFKN